MKRVIVIWAAVLACVGAAFAADSTVPGWLSAVRGGRAPLVQDAALMDAAASYARTLAELGRLSHTGPDGSDALTRSLRAGGTCAHVAEIIGAGPALADIQRAWMESPSHREAILKDSWTDVGWGRAATAAGQEVWVVMFAQRLVTGLRVETRTDGGWTVAGVLRAPGGRPVLLSGLLRLEAAEWDAGTGRFLFRGRASEWSGYVRLGYVTGTGGLVITDVLTSPRGTGSR